MNIRLVSGSESYVKHQRRISERGYLSGDDLRDAEIFHSKAKDDLEAYAETFKIKNEYLTTLDKAIDEL